ncbi:hypothetical protein H2200_006278 [Cladophialophora chaetospira]|uniref:RNA polymerase I-specific transcription initiation factor RRN6-like protein n=1 Tax=Cladophialophora chaetospira TaxID=386627 RepID=A0AA38XBA8_9EURO|nr:hypothetical protein H2200_006278 [Cladophialophora chaetospira]
MAEARRARHHVHETSALSYGHFGTATYDDQKHEWWFLRQHEDQQDSGANEEHVTGSAVIYFEPINERAFNPVIDASLPNNKFRPHTTNARGLQNLFLNNIPEASLIGTSPPPSAYDLDSLQGFSAQTRTLANTLALGHARKPLESGLHSNVPATAIVAMPAGPHLETLRLLGFEARQVEIRNDAGLHKPYTLPFVGNTAFGQWCESADPILQVSSAPEAKGTQFLVVKPSGTTILRPMLVDALPGVLTSTEPAVRSTSIHRVLDPCPAATIPSSRTGESPHAYAALNLDDQNMVAIVDVSGQWSTWKLTGSESRSARILYRAHLLGSNNLNFNLQHSSLKSGFLEGDDWHRVSWLASSKGTMARVLVCNRRLAAVYGQGGEFVGQVDTRLGPLSERNVILDIKNSNHHRGHLFVLTTSRLLVFSSTEGSRKERNLVQPLELVSSWNHFRDRADLSLRMSIIESPKDSWILVSSRSDTFALMYRFGYESSSSNLVSLADPSIFHLPQLLKDQGEDVSDIVLCPVKIPHQSRPFVAADHALIKLIAGTKDGRIIEALYKHNFSQSGPAEEHSGTMPVLSLPRLSNPIPRSTKYIDEDDLDDFVLSKTIAGLPFPAQEVAVSDSLKEAKPTTFNSRSWESLLENLALEDEEDEETSWTAALRQAIERFEQSQGPNKPMSGQLIPDLVKNASIMDLEADSRSLETWLDDLAVRPDIDSELVSFPKSNTNGAHHQLLNHYNKLVDAFVQPLSDQMTDRNRVNRERLVRQIAGLEVLGAVMLRTKQPFGRSESHPPEAAPNSEPAVPYPSPAPDSEDAEYSQSSTHGVSVASEEPAVARLRQYVDFRHQVPPLLLDHIPATSIILGHLPASMQEDPAEYSYQEKNQRMKLVQEQHAAESLDPKQRQKALKSAARLQRKLERNRLVGQEAVLQRSLLPSIGTGTEVTTLPGRDVQSSQAVASGSSQMNNQDQDALPGLTMTQPERGAFGTRQAAKKVKKRRAGF